MANFGGFANEFDANMLAFWPIVVGLIFGLPVFGYFYNQLMDNLPAENEHTSMYVAAGVLVTILAGALISWKAALLFLTLFTLSGLPMIVGDYRRGKRKSKQLRRKRLPYAANGMIDDASMAAEQTGRHLTAALKKRDDVVEMLAAISLAGQELTTLRLKLAELKGIQVSEK